MKSTTTYTIEIVEDGCIREVTVIDAAGNRFAGRREVTGLRPLSELLDEITAAIFRVHTAV